MSYLMVIEKDVLYEIGYNDEIIKILKSKSTLLLIKISKKIYKCCNINN